ncbi:LysR family transcriptional regulator [Beggiatoa alba]|nr:LysR family transcriptional regulator [Beggiatoa alba]
MSVFEEMNTFVKVVDAGSITGAAERMNTAKSAVSRRLSELERRLGVQLLKRSTRRMSLTETGKSYYEQCVRILSDVAETEAAVTTENAALKGKLRITAPLSFGILHLSSAVADFMQAHPELTLDVQLSDNQINLVDEGYDLAIRITDLDDSTLIARRLISIHMIACASPNYLKQHGTPQTPEEMIGHDFLHYGNRIDSVWTYKDKQGNVGRVRLNRVFSANNGSFLRDIGIAGRGLMIQPVFIVYKAIEREELVPILLDYQWQTLNAYAVYPPTRHLSYRVRVFIDFLVKRFGDQPYWDECLKK